MDFDNLLPEEKKRAQAEVQQDAGYASSRKMLLLVSTACAVALGAMGLMLMNDMLNMLTANALIMTCVMVYLYFIIRVVQMRKAAEARWMLAQAESNKKKKALKSKNA